MEQAKKLQPADSGIVSDFLSHLQSIGDFEEWELTMLTDNIQVKKVKKGTCLLNFGDISKNLYFVNKGCLGTFYITDNGSEFIRCLAMEKSFCWTIPGFLNQQPGNESIEAIFDSELIMISKKNFDTLHNASQGFRNAYNKGLEMLCISYALRLESFLTMDARTRYKNLLAKNPEIVQKMPGKIVASYLGITQESLSRIKKQF